MNFGKNGSFLIILPAQTRNKPNRMLATPKITIIEGILLKNIDNISIIIVVGKIEIIMPAITKANPIPIRNIPPILSALVLAIFHALVTHIHYITTSRMEHFFLCGMI